MLPETYRLEVFHAPLILRKMCVAEVAVFVWRERERGRERENSSIRRNIIYYPVLSVFQLFLSQKYCRNQNVQARVIRTIQQLARWLNVNSETT